MLGTVAFLALTSLVQDSSDARFVEHRIAEMPPGIELAEEFPSTMPITTRPTRRVGFDAGESHHVGWTGDGLEVAYVGQRGSEFVPVINDRVGEAFDDVFAPTVGPCAGAVAFRCVRGAFEDLRWILLHGDARPVEHRWIGTPVFSPDASGLVYWCEPEEVRQPRGAKQNHPFILHGLSKRPQPKTVISRFVPPVFTADGKSVLTMAVHESEWCVLKVTGTKEQVVGTASGDLVALDCTPDGKSWAFSGTFAHRIEGKRRGEGATFYYRCVVRDDERVGPDAAESCLPLYSPNGAHLAHRIVIEAEDRRSRAFGIAIDGESIAPPDNAYVAAPVWSRDSKSLAFVGSRNKAFLANAPVTCQRMDAADREGGDRVFVYDLGGALEAVSEPTQRIEKVVFAPDGEGLAWAERRSDGWWVVAGDQRAGPYDEVGPLQFDESGARLAYGTREGREFWWRVLEVELRKK